MRNLIAGSLAAALLLVLGAGQGFAAEKLPADSPLLNPKSEAMNETAPEVCKIKFETTAGDVIIEVKRAWAPKGADRFYSLVKNGFYDNCRFFRIVPNFVAQFGINGDPQVAAIWREARITDDPVKRSNTRGFLSFATAGPNTRTTQIFINYGDNGGLDGQGFAPFGKVLEGMDIVDKFFAGYASSGPDQGKLQYEGNAYLEKEFPKLDYIKKASVMPEEETK